MLYFFIVITLFPLMLGFIFSRRIMGAIVLIVATLFILHHLPHRGADGYITLVASDKH